MPAIALDTARTIAVVATIAFGVLAAGAGILLRSIAQKLAMVTIFGLLALLVWSQRTALDECADVVRRSYTFGEGATCSFFGRDILIRSADAG